MAFSGQVRRAPGMIMNFKRSMEHGSIDGCSGGWVFLLILKDPLDCATMPVMHPGSLVLERQITGPGLESLC